MKKPTICLLCLLLLISSRIYSQSTFPDEVYEGGVEGFSSDFGKYVQYPQSARANLYYTTALVNILVSPAGKLKKIELLNQVDYGIGQEVIRVLTKVTIKWKPFESGDDKSIVVAVTFTLEEDYIAQLEIKKTATIAQHLVITAHASPASPTPVNYRMDYQSLQRKAKKYLEKGKDQEAFEVLGRLLSINPFEKEFYTQRIELSQKINDETNLCLDALAFERIFSSPPANLASTCK